MTPKEVEGLLSLAISCLENESNDTGTIKRVSTFAGAGVMTSNAGLILTTQDGGEFQITIVQSRRPNNA